MDERCEKCERPLTPSQRKEARRKAAKSKAVWDLIRQADEEYKKSPEYASMQKWLQATRPRPEDMRRVIR